MATVEAVHGEVMIEVFALVACAHSARGQPPPHIRSCTFQLVITATSVRFHMSSARARFSKPPTAVHLSTPDVRPLISSHSGPPHDQVFARLLAVNRRHMLPPKNL